MPETELRKDKNMKISKIATNMMLPLVIVIISSIIILVGDFDNLRFIPATVGLVLELTIFILAVVLFKGYLGKLAKVMLVCDLIGAIAFVLLFFNGQDLYRAICTLLLFTLLVDVFNAPKALFSIGK